MKLGIDFGTTRIIVAVVDRGNYPLVPFETPEGTYDWFPSLAAVRRDSNGTERRFGWDAWAVQTDPGWTVLRSLKRHLEDAGPQSRLSVDGLEIPLTELLGGLTAALHQELAARFGTTAPLEAMLGVPANANSNQRFPLTVDAFRRAGFFVTRFIERAFWLPRSNSATASVPRAAFWSTIWAAARSLMFPGLGRRWNPHGARFGRHLESGREMTDLILAELAAGKRPAVFPSRCRSVPPR
jgi:hypothetical protein